MSDVYDVVTEDRFYPSTVVGVEFVLEEAVMKGLAVCLNFDWWSEDVWFEFIDAVFECCKL